MQNVMVDLETLGKRAGCVIISIGAVVFDPSNDKLGEEFYSVVSSRSCVDKGLHVDDETLRWWSIQSEQAQDVFKSSMDRRANTIDTALIKFNDWLSQLGPKKEIAVWGNGSDFDNAIMYAAYAACGIEPAWHFWNSRCFRTLKNLTSIKAEPRIGIHHNALDDARFQALHANKIFSYLEHLQVK